MRIKDLIFENSPSPGDILEIEVDDVLIEASILDLMGDDVVIHLDETALKLLMDSRKKLDESLTRPLKPLTQAELELYNIEIKKLGKKIEMLNQLYLKYKNLKDMFKMSKVKERIADITKEKTDLTQALDDRFGKISETGAPAPHRLNPEPEYAMTEDELNSHRKLKAYPLAGEPLDNYTDLLDFVKQDRQRSLVKALENDLGVNFLTINKVAKTLHSNPQFYSKPRTANVKKARELLLRVTNPDGSWKQDMGFKTSENPDGDDPETYKPQFWTMRPASLRVDMNEAEYQGRKVSLGKPFLTPDGPKKRSVYVKNSKGRVVKVNFGQKGVKIKKSIPARRKSFRARHNCSTAKDRTTPRYWSCRFW